MGHNGNSYYIGIDLNDSYAMVSFFLTEYERAGDCQLLL